MKKLKLFSKTYIFTMALISMIIIISHILIYSLLITILTNLPLALDAAIKSSYPAPHIIS